MGVQITLIRISSIISTQVVDATSTNISCIVLKIIRFFNTAIQIPPPRNHFFSHHIHLVTVLVTVDCSEWVK